MKHSRKVRNPGGGNPTSAASGSRDRSSGMSGNRGGGSKDSSNIRHSSTRPMSSSPSRMAGDIQNHHRGQSYQQHGGAEGHSSVGANASVADGVYSNKRLMHACTCLIGATVQVETIDGNIHEGLFRTFSPDLEITLEQAHQIDPKNPTTITAEVVKEIMIFEMKEVLHMSAIGVDLDYAAKEGFQTDTQISKNNGEGGDRYRELKEFEFDDYNSLSDGRLEGSFSIDDGHTLEDGSNGWSANEMFKMNETKYGVQTSYKENMEGYTVQLKQQDKSSEEYRDREARAAQVAREIEGTTSSHLAAELENGDDDEEAAFSAVQRDTVQRNDVRDPDSGGKYITPARRQPSTSSNSGSMPGKHMNSGHDTLDFTYISSAQSVPNNHHTILVENTIEDSAVNPASISLMESSNSDSMSILENNRKIASQEATTQTSNVLETSTLNPRAPEFVSLGSPSQAAKQSSPMAPTTPNTYSALAHSILSPIRLPIRRNRLSFMGISQAEAPYPVGAPQVSPAPSIQTHQMQGQNFQYLQSHANYTAQPIMTSMLPQGSIQMPASQIQENSHINQHFQANPHNEVSFPVMNAGQSSPSMAAIQQHQQMQGHLIQYVPNHPIQTHQMQGQNFQYLQSHANYTAQPIMSNMLPQGSIQMPANQFQENSPMNQHFQANPHSETSFPVMNTGQSSPSVAAIQAHQQQMQGHLIQYVPNHPIYSGQAPIPNMMPQQLMHVAVNHIQENNATVNSSFTSTHDLPLDATFPDNYYWRPR